MSTIEKYGDLSKLPQSYTYFNELDLPPYKDIKTLEDELRLATQCATLVSLPLAKFLMIAHRETEGFGQG